MVYYPKIFLRLLTSILFIISSASVAQDINISSLKERLNRTSAFVNYTTKDGLSQNAIYTIMQDDKGFIWFGTQGGVNRFNGYDFKVYNHDDFDSTSIPHSYVNKIFQDSQNRIWICTEAGLSLFSKLNESFSNFTHDDQNSNSISDNYVWTIFEDRKNNFWVGTAKGLSRFIPEENKFIEIDFSGFITNKKKLFNVYAINEDRSGNLWIGSRGYGVFRIDLINGINSSSFDYNIIHFIVGNNDVRDFAFGKDGRLYAATFGTGIFHLDQESDKFVKTALNLSSLKLKRPQFIKVLFTDESQQDLLWMGTEEDGLILVDTYSNNSIKFTHDSSIPSSLSGNMVYSIYRDRTGLMWIGSNQGINLLNTKTNNFQHFRSDNQNTNSLTSNTIGTFVEDKKGILWVGTDGGGVNLINRQLNKISNFRYDPNDRSSLSSDRAMIVFEDNKSNIWIGTYGGGLNKFNQGSGNFKRYKSTGLGENKLCSDYITSIVQDKSGNIWLGTTTGGVIRFNPENEKFKCFINTPDDPQSLSDNHVWIIYIDSQNVLWAGTRNGGLNELIDTERGLFKRYIQNKNDKMSLSNNTIFEIFESSKGDFWVGTNSGLNKMDRETGQFLHYRNGSLPAPLNTAGIEEDAYGRLWLLQGNAIVRFNPADNEIKTYDNKNGMMITDLRIWSTYKNKTGEMFFGGANGFTIFHPDSLKDNSFIPPIAIDDFKRFNTDDKSGNAIAGIGIPYKEKLSLSYKDNIFSFSFAAMNFINPAKNQYAYKLEGFNDDWINIGTQRTVTFTNIDPGSYTFRVKGSNDDGLWNNEGASIAVNIAPPFWETWWFRTSVILLVFIALFSYVRSKLVAAEKHHKEQEAFARQLIETEEMERQRIANELHDSLGQNLLVIKNSLLVKQQQEHVDGSSLTETSDLVSGTIQEVRSISHNLRPHLLDQLGLTKTIKSLVKQINNSSELEIIEEIDDLKGVMEPKAEINLYRLIQESINNIIKHSFAEKAWIKIKLSPTHIHISIKDNGKGMDVSEIKSSNEFGKGFGLDGMAKRAHVYNWSFQLHSEPGKGTEIILTIPLNGIS